MILSPSQYVLGIFNKWLRHLETSLGNLFPQKQRQAKGNLSSCIGPEEYRPTCIYTKNDFQLVTFIYIYISPIHSMHQATTHTVVDFPLVQNEFNLTGSI